MLFESRIGFGRESDGNDFLYARFPRGTSQQPRINAVSRDDPESFERLQWSMFARHATDVDLTSDGGV